MSCSLLSPSVASLSLWSASEWSVYGAAVCDAFTSKVQDCIDRHERERDRRVQERAMRAGDGDDDGGEEEDEEDGEPQLTAAEETELSLIVSNSVRCVMAYVDDRLLLHIGMDERVLLALSALNGLCHHVVSHSELMSVDGQIGLLRLFPDLAQLSEAQVHLWMAHQRGKLQTLLGRVLAQHQQHAVATVVDASTPFSASVLDMFTILSATCSGYFEHLGRLAPFGLATFSAFLAGLEGCVVEYSRAVLRAMGEAHTLAPRGDDECKLKQSDEYVEHQSLLSKKAAMLHAVTSRHPALRVAKVEHAAKSSVEKAVEELAQRSAVDPADPSSVASHSVEELSVHVASIQACSDMLLELQQQIKAAWTALCKQKPQIRDKAEELLAATEAQQQQQQPSDQRGGAVRSALAAPSDVSVDSAASASASASALLRLSSGTSHLFPSAAAALYADRRRACELLSLAVVFVQWRAPLLVDLYNPSAAEGSHVVGGPLLDAVNGRMPLIYKAVQPSLFPVLCQCLLTHLCQGLCYVLVYGRRVVEQADVQAVLLPDILAVELLFASELSALTVESCVHDYRRLLSVVGWSTEKMLAVHADYAAKRCPVPRMTLARLLGLRRGSLASHFIKTERARQKRQHSPHQQQQQQQQPQPSLHSLPLSSVTAAAVHGADGGSSTNPFFTADEAKDEDGAEDWEVVSVSSAHPAPTALPVSASFPPPRPSSGWHATDEAGAAGSGARSIPIGDLLSRNSVRSPTALSQSASASLHKTQRALSHGLAAGVSKGKSLYSKLKAKV